MSKTYLPAALGSAAMLFAATMAIAAVAGEFGNYCAMGLTKGEKKLTDCSISQKIEKKTYCFGSTSAKEAFMQDPDGNIAKAQAEFSK